MHFYDFHFPRAYFTRIPSIFMLKESQYFFFFFAKRKNSESTVEAPQIGAQHTGHVIKVHGSRSTW